MEAAAFLIGIPPPKRPFFLPTTNPFRRTSLITRAEPPPDATERPRTGEASISPPPPRPVGSGSGFGGTADETKRNRRGKERSAVVRRSPIERKDRKSPQEPPQQSANESAFLLTWLGLGSLILVEGLALATSGFLPDEWDNFLVKYLYPSFTPTVFLFVGGTVVYGVIKYLELEKMKS